MESASKFLTVPRSFREVSGICQRHGESTALLHPKLGRQEWYCTTCDEEARKAADQAAWLKSRNETLHRVSCVPQKYVGKKFEVSSVEQKQVRMTVKAFRNEIASRNVWAVLVLMGSPGTGKTLLSCELAQALIDNLSMSVRYCTTNQMITEIQSSYSHDGKSEEGEILKFSQYDVLILDEIDAKRQTDNANLLLTEVINRRYNAERPVIVITNQPMESLAQYVGDRVFSRLHENTFVCAFDWADQRMSAA